MQHDQDEMEVLFTLLAERYERRSVAISTNLVFSEWERIFKNPMTTLAAIDRVVHHAVILDLLQIDSYRVQAASGPGPAGRAQTPEGPAHTEPPRHPSADAPASPDAGDEHRA